MCIKSHWEGWSGRFFRTGFLEGLQGFPDALDFPRYELKFIGKVVQPVFIVETPFLEPV
jgi:hypothetical protein